MRGYDLHRVQVISLRERGKFAADEDVDRAIGAMFEALGQKTSAGRMRGTGRFLPFEAGEYLKQTQEAKPLTLSDFLSRISDKEGF